MRISMHTNALMLAMFGAVAAAQSTQPTYSDTHRRDAGATPPVPLLHAHAHNDYEHKRPLLDALACGFCSIEADVWLVDGKLLVAHGRKDAKPERSIAALYLDPLRERVRANRGRVYRDGPPVQLLIDLKSEAEPTYAALHKVLEGYRDMLTTYRSGRRQQGAVTVIITGNRPREMMLNQPVRYAACDGLLEDLDTNSPAGFVPLISSRWGITFAWNGKGPIPPAERRKLQELVQRAHQQQRRIRFWGAPDTPAAWAELRADGVDMINTDNLAGVRDFLLKSVSSATRPD